MRGFRRSLVALTCAVFAAAAGSPAWAEEAPPSPETVPTATEVAPIDPLPTPDPAPSPEPAADPLPAQPAALQPVPESTAPETPESGKKPSAGESRPGSKPKHRKGKPRPAQKPRPAASSGPTDGWSRPGEDGTALAGPVAGGVKGRAVSVEALAPAGPSDSPPALLAGALLAALALAIALFGLAAAPAWVVPGARVFALVAERRAELAVAGTLALVTAAAVLVLITTAL